MEKKTIKTKTYGSFSLQPLVLLTSDDVTQGPHLSYSRMCIALKYLCIMLCKMKGLETDVIRLKTL